MLEAQVTVIKKSLSLESRLFLGFCLGEDATNPLKKNPKAARAWL